MIKDVTLKMAAKMNSMGDYNKGLFFVKLEYLFLALGVTLFFLSNLFVEAGIIGLYLLFTFLLLPSAILIFGIRAISLMRNIRLDTIQKKAVFFFSLPPVFAIVFGFIFISFFLFELY